VCGDVQAVVKKISFLPQTSTRTTSVAVSYAANAQRPGKRHHRLPSTAAKSIINLYLSLLEDTKRMWIIKNAGHNDWPMYADASLWKEMTNFVKVKKKQ
jgi:hypothetical protein